MDILIYMCILNPFPRMLLDLSTNLLMRKGNWAIVSLHVPLINLLAPLYVQTCPSLCRIDSKHNFGYKKGSQRASGTFCGESLRYVVINMYNRIHSYNYFFNQRFWSSTARLWNVKYPMERRSVHSDQYNKGYVNHTCNGINQLAQIIVICSLGNGNYVEDTEK